ncbi:sensor domain-containing diguanylate cyclase/phosphohydrolase [Selenihalanaerobacter shriftii]|uniref:PAS domain S-box-containing protein/diguanylate cyclase (GGDEF) domain-containing protein n=1 Tax=Selenihalanaerobacter shriftii TaxID=142842 RepID=A0A1T4LQB5_9FIRM|nr:PAS domain S-box protein [Selenihalanaerobacter shriftii]SJZ56885.1 PAS domain S-box-containing protein/diguanylate cyclase (GGDEF) domain-containing protein [Selenihalanaerobacter shriftii]
MKIKSEVKFFIIYILVGFSWILFSDKLINRLLVNQIFIGQLQTIKGMIYVLINGVIGYLFIRRILEKVKRNKEKIKEKNKALEDNYLKIQSLNRKLIRSKEKYQKIYNNAPLAFIIWDNNFEITDWNKYAEKIFGWSKEEMVGKNILKHLVLNPNIEDMDKITDDTLKYINIANINKNFTKKRGIITCEWYNQPLYDTNGDIFKVISLAKDITNEKRLEQRLKEQEQMYRTLFENTSTSTMILNRSGTIELVNNKLVEMSGYSKEELVGKGYEDFLASEDGLESVKECRLQSKSATKKVPNKYEIKILDNWEQIRSILVQVNIIPDTGKIIVSFIDITKRKKKEEKIKNMSYRDPLTGLYNRKYYDEKLERLDTQRELPLSIIIGDANRLKLTNDILGHKTGDNLLKKIAKILKESTRKCDIIARWGGDEFGIILPQTSKVEAQEVIKRIKEKVKNENLSFVPLQIGLGCATKVDIDQYIEEVFEEAEEEMYQDKQVQKNNSDSQLLKMLINKLESTDYKAVGHTPQIVSLAQIMGERLDLENHKLKQLSLLAKFHDIGKLINSDGISDDNVEIAYDFKEHTETSYDILTSFQELRPIASYIFYNYEHWDGSGFPKGLKHKEIPLISRIIHIIDAFDTMTHEVEYPIDIERYSQEAISEEEAIVKIENLSGSIFDPNLVDVFVEIVK